MTVNLEQLAFTLCPHLQAARTGVLAPCSQCPKGRYLDFYGPETNECRRLADAAARAAMAVIEPEEGR